MNAEELTDLLTEALGSEPGEPAERNLGSQLSAARRGLGAGDPTAVAGAREVVEVVARERLRADDDDERERMPSLPPERVRLDCHQLVQG